MTMNVSWNIEDLDSQELHILKFQVHNIKYKSI